MDPKLLFSLISTAIGAVSFAAYIREILLGKTRPHIYTWLIWLITQGLATAGLWYGGGGIGALELTSGTFLILCVIIMSFWYGTRNIKRSDTVVLVVAFCAVPIWLFLHNPVLAVVMASAIDVIGYAPSVRKSFQEPWSESLLSWFGFIASNVFAVMALEAYNPLTLTYLIAVSVANAVLMAVCLLRRPLVARPQTVTT